MFKFHLTGSAEFCSWRVNVGGWLLETCVSVEEERRLKGECPAHGRPGKPTPPHPQCDSILGAGMALSKSVEKSPLG